MALRCVFIYRMLMKQKVRICTYSQLWNFYNQQQFWSQFKRRVPLTTIGTSTGTLLDFASMLLNFMLFSVITSLYLLLIIYNAMGFEAVFGFSFTYANNCWYWCGYGLAGFVVISINDGGTLELQLLLTLVQLWLVRGL